TTSVLDEVSRPTLHSAPTMIATALSWVGDPRAPPSFPTRRSSDLRQRHALLLPARKLAGRALLVAGEASDLHDAPDTLAHLRGRDRKSTRLNSSHVKNSYAVFCLKKKNEHARQHVAAHDAEPLLAQ